ncbi:MAG: DUF6118 family protein [Pseudomonadota bacterium]|nr:DUF6118 family protein [Pseudomonadota bacterium]
MQNVDPEEVELEIEAEPYAPAPEAESDPAAEAFARLEGELALMRRAVQHPAAERADIVIPDYSATLAEMTKRLEAVAHSITTIADHPAMQMTPDSLGHRIETVAESARRADHDRISQAQTDLGHAAREMRSVTTHARTVAKQRVRLVQAAGGGMLAGMLLWSVLPGPIARSLPATWQVPERIARRALGEPSIMDTGIRLIRSENPKAWQAILEAARLSETNRQTIGRCRSLAQKTGRPANCSVRVDP